MSIHLSFLIIAIVLAFCATIGWPAPPRFNMLAASFLSFLLSIAVGSFSIHG